MLAVYTNSLVVVCKREPSLVSPTGFFHLPLLCLHSTPEAK